MRSQIDGMGASFLDSYSSKTPDRDESAQRAAEMRKKLQRAAAEEIEVESDLDVDWMVRPGYEAAGYRGRGRMATLSQSEVEIEDSGVAVAPISVWA